MTNEKTPIKPEDIRAGDLIREERDPLNTATYRAVEYRASGSKVNTETLTYYLLDRPEPPFQPTWGVVIHDPGMPHHRAVYSPAYRFDGTPWIVARDLNNPKKAGWRTEDWAKKKLEKGWKVLEKPSWIP